MKSKVLRRILWKNGRFEIIKDCWTFFWWNYIKHGASSMQMICSIFKVFGFLPVVFCVGWLEILLNAIYFEFVFCHCGDSENPVTRIFLFFRVLDIFGNKKVIAFGPVMDWIHSQQLLCPYSWFQSKNHPTYIHCLRSCLHINVTHSGMNQMTATVCYMGQHVVWCDWLVTQNSR